MKTLFDFVSHNNGIEYLLAIAFILGYAVFTEFLKPRPFRGFVSSVMDDARYLRDGGAGEVRRLMKNILIAPFVAAAYIALLPLYMMVGILLRTENALSSVLGGGSMAWRPLEAYLSGRSVKRSKKVKLPAKEEEKK